MQQPSRGTIRRMAMTPMMQQYHDAKDACGDALLFFRMGDFYELFADDAKIAAKAVGLTLTSRDKNSDNPVPMAGFPHHQLEGYLSKLITLGHRVAICEQVEDPKKAKGLVKRDITRVVTPGTLTDDALLDPRESNFLAAVVVDRKNQADPNADCGLAWVELSTGLFYASIIKRGRLTDELARIGPSECLVPDGIEVIDAYLRETMMVTQRPAFEFAQSDAKKTLEDHFQTLTLEGFGFDEEDVLAYRSAGAVLTYLNETQRASLDHIERIVPYRPGSSLEIDLATRRSLEITRTMRDGRRDGSLLSVIDRTVTPMGSRMFSHWIANPLTNLTAINGRLDAVQELTDDELLNNDLQDELKHIYDMQRLLARVTTGRASPRDLLFIGRTLAKLPKIKARLTARTSKLLMKLEADLDLCPDLRSSLETALDDDCPLTSRDGGFIRTGYNEELDRLRELATGGKEWIAQYQADIGKTAGISNLKVGFNKVFGYYIEITNAHKDKVPENFIRKQTLKNAERYITPELKEYEEKVLSADDKAKELEYNIFLELRELVHVSARRLQATADVLAQIDVLAALGQLARQQGYCRPKVVEQSELRIIDGRHPVLDITSPKGTFVANDTLANRDEEGMILLITGPNMAGKSTYIRQVALINLMAQVGSFVPAKEATVGIADRIFARVGASDELSRGQSTFMVEMTETARILNTATDRSLVILDEIGRGTSTYDGLSLAWAIVEHIHDRIGCRTLFATHYHELTDLKNSLNGIKNLNVSVKEWQDDVVFLHKIIDGAADKSYGIHVARLAGVPSEVNDRARQILHQLESQNDGSAKQHRIDPPHRRRKGDIQLTLFEYTESPLVKEIRELNADDLTPLDALMKIQTWQDQLKKEAVE